ncbi:hypothetical protein [Myceligenerans pegani]|uniref:Uncharacterized protein n=1 Tax=Myceligenerans pegani TaxID=2776917 RepID=A0ABR9N070_9MICO|nr:hypothetical protein [Myceligenerans sp. TRM 65318]MBE1877049.1 hypothetical protein [Myceligenerans sp. TRM 65318]MBE3019320.1 hypothetical protein [Myceligenerans sp. TRM 65318]
MSDHMSDQEFVSRLRDTAFDAAGSSTLDVDSVLRSSRRKHAARRAGYAAAAGLALSTAGFGAAGAIPGVPGLWSDGPVQVSPSSSASVDGETVDAEPAPTPEPTAQTAGPATLPAPSSAKVAKVGPAVWQVTEPGTVMVDDDTALVDLGLSAWGDGLNFFAQIELGTEGDETIWEALRVFAGTDADFRAMTRGDTAGTLLWDGITNDAMVRRADGGASLVFGLTSGLTSGAQHLVLDEPLAPDDPSTTSVEITPFDVLGDGEVWLRVAEVRSPVEPRGFVYADGARWGASWCRTTSPECTVTYNAAEGVVKKPSRAELSPMVTDLGQVMTEGAAKPVVAAMEVCVSSRTGDTWTAPAGLTEDTLGTVPDGIDAGKWRQCLIDLTEAAVAVQRGLIEIPVGGDDPGSGGSEDPSPTTPGPSPSETERGDSTGPIETVTDGVGKLLEGALGGVGDALGGDSGG